MPGTPAAPQPVEAAAASRPADATAAAKRSQYVFLAGAISGIAEGVSVQPLELLKTRFQIHTGEHLQILPTIREILREGGIRQLYRGGLPEISGLVPRATAALSTLVRLMAKEHLGHYANTWDCLTKVLRQEGPTALAIGLTPTLFRNCIWNGIFYGSMYELEHHVLQPLDSKAAEGLRSVAVGTGVGICATMFNAPFDVVKSRFQSQLPHARKYKHVFPTLLTIAREEGPRAMYRGFLPKTLRLGLGQSIGLVTFTNLLRAFGADQ